MTTRPAAVAIQVFTVPAERVYDAILDPLMIGRFMFGPLVREEKIVNIHLYAKTGRLTTNPQVGDTFSYKVHRSTREGEVFLDHVGAFLELDRPRRIAFTWAIAPDTDGSTVAIDIAPTQNGCSLTLTHEMAPQWADYVDSARNAWAKMLGVLAQLLVADRPA